jgi:hypothetical protein
VAEVSGIREEDDLWVADVSRKRGEGTGGSGQWRRRYAGRQGLLAPLRPFIILANQPLLGASGVEEEVKDEAVEVESAIGSNG